MECARRFWCMSFLSHCLNLNSYFASIPHRYIKPKNAQKIDSNSCSCRQTLGTKQIYLFIYSISPWHHCTRTLHLRWCFQPSAASTSWNITEKFLRWRHWRKRRLWLIERIRDTLTCTGAQEPLRLSRKQCCFLLAILLFLFFIWLAFANNLIR